MEGAEIVVVGSINLDLSVTVERFPMPGETVQGTGVVRGGGGKGANQAVAAARLGRRVAMVGRVGDDEAGPERRASLAAEGIDVAHVAVQAGAPTGLALIEVDAAGENRIVVVPGANAAVGSGGSGPDDLDRATEVLAAAAVVLVQFEIPLATAADLAHRQRGGRLIVNPAPAPAGGAAAVVAVLDGADVLVPNRGELAELVGSPAATTTDEVIDQARSVGGHLEAVVVTLGAEGSLVVEGLRDGRMRTTTVPAAPVDAVDTTAAGDAFCGALADALCDGADYAAAAAWAGRVAGVAVTRRGAQDSLPTRDEVLAAGPP